MFISANSVPSGTRRADSCVAIVGPAAPKELSIATLPLVSDAEARDVVSMADALAAVEQTYGDLGTPGVTVGSGGHPPGRRTRGFALKAALLDRYGVAGIRVMPTAHRRAQRFGAWYWRAPRAGHWSRCRRRAAPVAYGASAVVAARLLARADSRILTLVGAGRIADLVPLRSRAVFNPHEVRVVARRESPPRTSRYATNCPASMWSATPASTRPHRARRHHRHHLGGRPTVHSRHLEPGGTLIGLGGGAEMAGEVLGVADRFFVDEFEYAREVGSMAGWLGEGMAVNDIRTRLTADLPAVVNGAVAGRTRDDERISGRRTRRGAACRRGAGVPG